MTFGASLAAVFVTLAGLFSAPAAHALQDQTGAEPATTVVGEPEAWEPVPGVTRAAILTAEGIVGLEFAAKPLREAIPMLKAEGIELVVLRVNSGGGMLSEAMAISDVLHEEFKPEFELIGLVDSAISAAFYATLTIDRIAFCDRGLMGEPDTVWMGPIGLQSERSLERVRSIAARGNHPAPLIESMLRPLAVSYDTDPETRKHRFLQDNSGKHVLSDGEYHYKLNAADALACGFSLGTADTLEELTALLTPEHGEIFWVGRTFEDEPFPLCMAERHQREWRDRVTELDNRFGESWSRYLAVLDDALGQSRAERVVAATLAEGYLGEMRRIVQAVPSIGMLNGLDENWFDQQSRFLSFFRAE